MILVVDNVMFFLHLIISLQEGNLYSILIEGSRRYFQLGSDIFTCFHPASQNHVACDWSDHLFSGTVRLKKRTRLHKRRMDL